MSRGGRQASSLYGVPGGKVGPVIVSTLGGGRQVLLPPPGAGAMSQSVGAAKPTGVPGVP